MLTPTIARSDTQAEVTLAQPSQRVFSTFDLYSGIGADPTDPGASPRLTDLTITSPDASTISVSPLPPPPNWATAGSQAIRCQGPLTNAPLPPVGATLVTVCPIP